MDQHPGTRFLLFPQLPTTQEGRFAETVWVSSPAGSVGPGPTDDRLYVVDPIGKQVPYGFYPGPNGMPDHYKPPWGGQQHPPALPDAQGHFDHIDFHTREFEQAHAFGCVRFTLDIWEDYFGGEIPFHFRADYDQLEIILLEKFDNAYAGFGSIELGSYARENGDLMDFALSFDVIAHELGHLIVYSAVGMPDTSDMDGEQFGFHESAADMVSLIALMHFESARDDLLEKSKGNLYSFNQLNRFAEVSDFEQLRLVSNDSNMWQFEQGWTSEHDLSQPLTAAFFDILVDVFHEELLAAGLMSDELEDLSDRLEDDPNYHEILQPMFDASYAKSPEGFAEALDRARDYLGHVLALTWVRLPGVPTYADFRHVMTGADDTLTGGRFGRIIEVNMARRGIGIVSAGPRQTPPDEESHAFSGRTYVPENTSFRPHKCTPYRTRYMLARGG